MVLLRSTPHFRLVFYRASHTLELTFVGFLSSVELRLAYDYALDEAARRQANYWLNDFGQMSAVRAADQTWLVEDFAPRLASRLRATLRRSAIVVATDPMNQLFADDVVVRTQQLRFWETRFFHSRAEAWDWLQLDLKPRADAVGEPSPEPAPPETGL